MSNYNDNDTSVLDKDDAEVKEPSMYKVVFYNDDYTPMHVVTAVLISFFGKSEQDANSIMMKVHKEGRGLAGTYTYDIAQTKKEQSISTVRALGFPLKIEIEEE